MFPLFLYFGDDEPMPNSREREQSDEVIARKLLEDQEIADAIGVSLEDFQWTMGGFARLHAAENDIEFMDDIQNRNRVSRVRRGIAEATQRALEANRDIREDLGKK